ncbi:MAG: FAD-dependent monooxygenase [Proteobacteria bacterium]|nr:FAD-dependent monooxygenase [Pseudomonadota bacterium]MDE3207360.1 FAD-dependent monooxygenase [Pseudomonadota bacterium]
MIEYDAVIVGGGPVGAMLGVMLASTGRSVAVIEARSTPGRDSRMLALSWGTRLIFESMGVWADLPVTPITSISVSQQNGFGRVHFSAEELDFPALGYVVRYADLEYHVLKVLRQHQGGLIEGFRIDRFEQGFSKVRLYSGQQYFDARLAVFADGGKLAWEHGAIQMREKKYAEYALVARVTLEEPARGDAHERFTARGPLALLPSGPDYALVWALEPEKAEAYCNLESGLFLKYLNSELDKYLPSAIRVDYRSVFPLFLREARSPIAHRIALIGNAAQTLHPVAGQGFNLGIRDARDLAQTLIHAEQDWGESSVLRQYANLRRVDSSAGLWWTDHLIEWFGSNNPVIASGRGVGLAALEMLPILRRWVSRKMIFGWRG